MIVRRRSARNASTRSARVRDGVAGAFALRAVDTERLGAWAEPPAILFRCITRARGRNSAHDMMRRRKIRVRMIRVRKIRLEMLRQTRPPLGPHRGRRGSTVGRRVVFGMHQLKTAHPDSTSLRTSPYAPAPVNPSPVTPTAKGTTPPAPRLACAQRSSPSAQDPGVARVERRGRPWSPPGSRPGGREAVGRRS